jgi:hypothetical protein
MGRALQASAPVLTQFLQWNEGDLREIKSILENIMLQQPLPGTVKITVHGVKNLPPSKAEVPGSFYAVIKFASAEIMRLPETLGHAPNMWQPKQVSM